jgi:hypothetical protein
MVDKMVDKIGFHDLNFFDISKANEVGIPGYITSICR